ncbi:Mov34/MPN/PAD-1 family protein [Paenibacillus silvisoli]|uniref:Mov34/MPN/PAD-1 family protein n=1 Tax=Paenibacillus silvisoli TaxID=3110539 RepID=UPI002805C27A|nr:Mov34/MPN/PAD-1 family protein [Paenibacillus silvisoli]
MNQPAPPFSHATITSDAYRLLVENCSLSLPNEACGILASDAASPASPSKHTVTAIYPIQNRSSSPRSRFDFEPAAWIEACYSMQKNRQSLVGYFHSHPSSLPLPSPSDLRGLHASSTTYWIVSLLQPNSPIIQPYWVEGGTFTPLMLTQISV